MEVRPPMQHIALADVNYCHGDGRKCDNKKQYLEAWKTYTNGSTLDMVVYFIPLGALNVIYNVQSIINMLHCRHPNTRRLSQLLHHTSRKRSTEVSSGSLHRSHAHTKCFVLSSSNARVLRGSVRLVYETVSCSPALMARAARTLMILPAYVKTPTPHAKLSGMGEEGLHLPLTGKVSL